MPHIEEPVNPHRDYPRDDHCRTGDATSATGRDADGNGSTVLEAALACCARGWRVLPLHSLQPGGGCTCGNEKCGRSTAKHPRISKWQHQASADEAVVRRWWTTWPAANLGIACGPESGLWVLDLDGPEGFDVLAGLCAENGDIPPTPVAQTGSGGWHYYFAWPTDGGLSPKTQSKLHGQPIDVRAGDGSAGQVVAPPSRNANGVYRWLIAPEVAPPAQAPGWLLEWVRSWITRTQNRQPDPQPTPRPTFQGGADVVERARRYLQRCPLAVSGQGGHGVTLWAARAVVYGFDLGVERGLELLLSEYNPRCSPPWSERELRHKCEEADRVPFHRPRGYLRDQAPERRPGPPPGTSSRGGDGADLRSAATPQVERGGLVERVELTDRGNAQRLAAAHQRDVRWVTAWEKWIQWDGQRWGLSTPYRVRALGARVLKDLYRWATNAMLELAGPDADAAQDDDKKARLRRLQHLQSWAVKSEAGARLNAMVDLLRSEQGVELQHTCLDQHPWMLNCTNGIVDLRSGTIREHRREDYLTALCPTAYRPEARCPTWERFVREVFADKEDLVLYIQRLLGYCLTGDVSAHMLPVFWGAGGNGKGTLINTVLHVMGSDYATPMNADFLVVRHGERHPTEVADLFGRRLVSCQETAEGAGLNEPLVKWLTGGDDLKARRMREDPWAFKPTHKLVLSTNHRPTVKGTDNGVWRRLRLVPFTQTFGGDREDRTLPDRLRAESEGILAWLVRGCLAWLHDGEQTPSEVLQATNEYKQEQDKVGQFINECCVLDPLAVTPVRVLYGSYEAWCKQANERAASGTAFGRKLAEKGFELGPKNSIKSRRGIRLADHAPAPARDS